MQDARAERRFRMWTEAGGRIRLEPTERRIRVMLGGVLVADSKRAQLLYLPPPNNTYIFPGDDVRSTAIGQYTTGDSILGLGRVERADVMGGGKVARAAAWTAIEPPEDLEALAGMVAFRWNQMDAWFEEDDEVFVHPRDPRHRVDVLNSSRHVRIEVDGQLVAETRRPRLLFETGLPVRYYIPRLDVRMDLLEPSATTTRCPYKGVASYWSLRVGDSVHRDLAWCYEAPIPECPKLENLICFFNERVDIDVDAERLPRPDTPWSR